MAKLKTLTDVEKRRKELMREHLGETPLRDGQGSCRKEVRAKMKYAAIYINTEANIKQKAVFIT